MLNDALKLRNVPELLKYNDGRKVETPFDWRLRREEILEILRSEIYGYSPELTGTVTGKIEGCDEYAFAGKAIQSTISIIIDAPKGYFSFPLSLIIPKKTAKPFVFLNIAFRPDIPDRYLPAEEIIDNGYAIANFCYSDVSPDSDDNFSEGLPALYPRDSSTGWGKISIWAWAASRVMDYLCTREDIDSDHVAVGGHSRLGKTALWCAAQDERFSMAISNESGCGGAALFRGKVGEHIADICRAFPFWFCGNFKKYIDREELLPWDQHYLLALIAPRGVYIGSAAEDTWADPASEFLSAYAASPAYELLGCKGLITPDKRPESGTALIEGKVAYQIREGSHFFSRSDWQRYMEYREYHGI